MRPARPLHRLLADKATVPIETCMASPRAESLARICNRRWQLRAAARIPAEVSDPSRRGVPQRLRISVVLRRARPPDRRPRWKAFHPSQNEGTAAPHALWLNVPQTTLYTDNGRRKPLPRRTAAGPRAPRVARSPQHGSETKRSKRSVAPPEKPNRSITAFVCRSKSFKREARSLIQINGEGGGE